MTQDKGSASAPPHTRIFDLRRLVAGIAVVALLIIPAYFLLLKETVDATVSPATLLDTPPSNSISAVGVAAGKLAPNFEVSTADGRRQRLAELRGKPVLINFWSSWCGSCLSEMPEIKALQEEKGRDTFSVLAINAGESREEAQAFIDFLQAPFVYGLDLNLAVADAYGVYGLPLSVFIDAGGVVQVVYRGHADRLRLEAFVAAAIDAKPAAEPAAALRTFTTIPRDRVLNVTRTAGNELAFTSRSLRCDASYCAPDIASRLLDPAVERAVFITEGEPRLVVRFRPDDGAEARIVSAVAGALAALRDPVYDKPLQVRFID
jgi:cytochrome c biogenesis protein CcmG, thiol:disulfide interchange protein DsbE